MRVLLDTHFLLWSVIDPDVLRAREHRILLESEVLVSAVSIWELRIKWQQRRRDGRRKGVLDPQLALSYVAQSSMDLAPLHGADCAVPLEVPATHGDPFDEMLLVHAQQLGARLLTRDRLLIDHPLAYRFS